MNADSYPAAEPWLHGAVDAEFADADHAEGALELAPDFNAAEHQKNAWQRTREFLGRHKGKIALGAAALSTTLTLAMNPIEEVQEKVVEAAPIIGTGIATSEALFIGGAAIMAASVGNKIGNPLKLKEQLPEICEKANNSLLFKTGFWTNTVGAVGTAAFFSTGVIAKMPPESYGVLSFAAADLAVTVAIRKVMLNGIKNNAKQNEEIEK